MFGPFCILPPGFHSAADDDKSKQRETTTTHCIGRARVRVGGAKNVENAHGRLSWFDKCATIAALLNGQFITTVQPEGKQMRHHLRDTSCKTALLINSSIFHLPQNNRRNERVVPSTIAASCLYFNLFFFNFT